MGILLGSLWLNSVLFPPPPPEARVPAATEGEGSAIPSAAPSAPSPETSKISPAPRKDPPARRTSDVPEKEIVVDTAGYRAVFSNRGAVMTSFKLKDYLNRNTKREVEMVESDPGRPKPFSLDYGPLPGLDQATFETKASSVTLADENEEFRLSFRFTDANGTTVEKAFGLRNGSYLLDVEVTVSKSGRGSVPPASLTLGWAPSLGMAEHTGTQTVLAGSHRVATLAGGRIDDEKPKKSQESKEIPPPVAWTALADQFFLAALIPDPASGAVTARVVRDFNAHEAPTEENPQPGLDPKTFAPRPLLVYPVQGLSGGQSFRRQLRAFLGPQDYSLLKGFGIGLEGIVDFGMFGFISVYMLKLLKWFDGWTHSWGLAIILLSILVKLLLWFPTHSSYKHMSQMGQKMKELQPKLEHLKKKYANDRQKQQQETMLLYQQAGINPMGGCLPLLLQMPVFFALYSTLSHSIELRAAPFLWLPDLSLKDPIYVLPLLMGASMFAQQKVSGQMSAQTSGQQKFMMWFFPIFLTLISFQWPSGLLVYWVVTNLLSMVQQKVVNREIKNSTKKVEVVKP